MSAQRYSPLQSLIQWDKDESYLIYRLYNAHFPRFPLVILEVSGHGLPWVIIPILVYIFKHNLSPSAAALLLNFIVLTAIDLAAIGILKPLFRRTRPAYNTGIGEVTIRAIDQFSFPSGHATRVAYIFSFLLYARFEYSDKLHSIISSVFLITIVFFWMIAVCVSRIALGRHHVLDVVSGVLFGLSYTFFWVPFWLGSEIAMEFRQLFRHIFLGTTKMIIFGSSPPAALLSER